MRRWLYFNPRAPYGARLAFPIHFASSMVFQSTRPIRGATTPPGWRIRTGYDFNPRAPYGARRNVSGRRARAKLHFNPRAPYGARHADCLRIIINGQISIHAPHTGRDYITTKSSNAKRAFQSTRPIRGATRGFAVWSRLLAISIHAPHTGRDLKVYFYQNLFFHFNPRAPYGARHIIAGDSRTVFSSISIHAPHTGRDHYKQFLPQIKH